MQPLLSLSLSPTMGASTEENGVLKLVHPGRHVEIHRQPITAAEVMRRNPRHCVARPDVFKFPWIVVRPESVLIPGKVFYVVPNRTIYDLLKARGLPTKPPSRSPADSNNHHKRNWPSIESSAGMTPKHHRFQRLFQTSVEEEEQDSDETKTIKEVKAYEQESDEECSGDFYTIDIKSFDSKSFDPKESSGRAKQGDLQIRIGEEEVKLKPCLRKEDSVRRLMNLRVNFVSPIAMTATSQRTSPAQIDHTR